MSRRLFIPLTLLYLLFSVQYYSVIPSSVFFVSVFILISYIWKLFNKLGNTKIGSLILVQVLLLPLSFRNIFGHGFDSIPISWFHLVGLILILLSFLRVSIKVNTMMISLMFCILLILPLSMNNESFIDVIPEVFAYVFHLLMLISTFYLVDKITNNDNRGVFISFLIDTYIVGVLFISVGVSFQYLVYKFFNIETFLFFKFGMVRSYFAFIFYDMSIGTLYMASGLIFLTEKLKTGRVSLDSEKHTRRNMIVNLKHHISFAIIVFAMIASSARTGIAIYFIYMFVLIFKAILKGNARIMILSFVLILAASFVFYNIYGEVRGVDNLTISVLDSNGRFMGYNLSLIDILNKPLFGNGFDYSVKLKIDNRLVPHFYVLYLTAQAGVIYASLFIGSHLSLWLKLKSSSAVKKVVLYTIIGSCLVPSFLSSRFFTILMMFIIIEISHIKPTTKYVA